MLTQEELKIANELREKGYDLQISGHPREPFRVYHRNELIGSSNRFSGAVAIARESMAKMAMLANGTPARELND